MKLFAKLTDIFGHAADLARHYLGLADQGVQLDQKYAAKAAAIIAMAERFIPAQSAAPTTILVPVPDAHAAALGAAPLAVK